MVDNILNEILIKDWNENLEVSNEILKKTPSDVAKWRAK
jgi:hypothetical protein